MKISVICMGRGSKVQNINKQEVVMYYVDFHVKREVNPHQQRFYGQLRVESPEPFHYKERQEYTLMVSDLLTIHSEAELKKIGNNN